VSVPATPVAKLKTLFQQLAVGFGLFPPTAVDGRKLWLTLLWIAAVLTVVSGAHYLLRSRRVATKQLTRLPQTTVS
jgi:phosphatidylglycerophosphate synthase